MLCWTSMSVWQHLMGSHGVHSSLWFCCKLPAGLRGGCLFLAASRHQHVLLFCLPNPVVILCATVCACSSPGACKYLFCDCCKVEVIPKALQLECGLVA
jgi:hypothetical protein